jgi:RNA polymerase sigma-70 factor (ECF subfamily)
MVENEWLTAEFDANRRHLQAVAYRMLGSQTEADDALQETWIRLHRSDTSDVANLGGWLTTVVARVCLDMLRSRTTRREEPMAHVGADPVDETVDPEDATLIAESIGPALLVVLETLTPPERVAFVLHDLFAVPFDEIAPIVGRSPAAARQLASRARRRVQGAPAGAADRSRQRAVVDAFLAARRGGNFDALLALLDPDVVLRADEPTVQSGAPAELRGAQDVATRFAGQARGARPALIDGAVGLVWMQGGQPRVVFDLTIVGERIAAIELLSDPVLLDGLELTMLDA